MVYTALSHPPCQLIPTAVWCRDYCCIYFTEEETEAPKREVLPKEDLAEQALKPRSSSNSASPLSHAVRKDVRIGDRRGGIDIEGLGVQGRLPGEK